MRNAFAIAASFVLAVALSACEHHRADHHGPGGGGQGMHGQPKPTDNKPGPTPEQAIRFAHERMTYALVRSLASLFRDHVEYLPRIGCDDALVKTGLNKLNQSFAAIDEYSFQLAKAQAAYMAGDAAGEQAAYRAMQAASADYQMQFCGAAETFLEASKKPGPNDDPEERQREINCLNALRAAACNCNNDILCIAKAILDYLGCVNKYGSPPRK